ncbi:hypothetical protein QQP08_023162 [Theobroma cacao]|nr:hypothetical protein QQP08_023162 [Theobroma cacao]
MIEKNKHSSKIPSHYTKLLELASGIDFVYMALKPYFIGPGSNGHRQGGWGNKCLKAKLSLSITIKIFIKFPVLAERLNPNLWALFTSTKDHETERTSLNISLVAKQNACFSRYSRLFLPTLLLFSFLIVQFEWQSAKRWLKKKKNKYPVFREINYALDGQKARFLLFLGRPALVMILSGRNKGRKVGF